MAQTEIECVKELESAKIDEVDFVDVSKTDIDAQLEHELNESVLETKASNETTVEIDINYHNDNSNNENINETKLTIDMNTDEDTTKQSIDGICSTYEKAANNFENSIGKKN